jgi:hypothetical protein
MKRPVRMSEDAWKSGLQRHVEAAVESGEAPTSKDVAGLARKLMCEGLLSHVKDTAAKGTKKAELQNRSNKVYRHVMLGRDDSETDEDASENPRNRKGRCGMCNYMNPAIGASILFGADAETELVDADARAAADKAKQELTGLEQSLHDGPSERERRRLREQIQGLTTSADDDADAAKERIAALETERDKAMEAIVRSEPPNYAFPWKAEKAEPFPEEHVQQVVHMKRLQADYEHQMAYIRDDARAAAALAKKKITALKEQLEDVKDAEGEERLRKQIEDLTPVALGPFWADVERLKRRGVVPYVGDYPAVELARYTAPICEHALFCSENCLIRWRVAKMCPNCGDTSRLGRKELDKDEARRLGVLEGVPDEEANRIIGRIAKLFKYRTAEMLEGLGGEEGKIHNTIRKLEREYEREVNDKIRELQMEVCAGGEPDALNPKVTKLLQAPRESRDEKIDELAKALGAARKKDKKDGGLNDEVRAKIKHECERLAEVRQVMKRVWKCKRCSTRTNTVLVCSRDPTVWLPDKSFETPHLLSLGSFP